MFKVISGTEKAVEKKLNEIASTYPITKIVMATRDNSHGRIVVILEYSDHVMQINNLEDNLTNQGYTKV